MDLLPIFSFLFSSSCLPIFRFFNLLFFPPERTVRTVEQFACATAYIEL